MKHFNFLIFLILLTQLSFSQTMYIHTHSSGIDSISISQIDSITFTVQGSPPPDSLVAYYPFNGSANDGSGNGNNGYTNGGMTWTTDRFGNPNNAANFISGSYDSIPHSASLTFSNDIAISAWVNFSAGGTTNPRIFSKGWGNNGYEVFFNGNPPSPTSRTVGFGIGDSTTTFFLYSHSSLNVNQWYHIVCMGNNSTMKIYINGTLDSSRAVSYTWRQHRSPITLGRISILHDGFFAGMVDDVRIYRRLLSDADVQALYHEGGW